MALWWKFHTEEVWWPGDLGPVFPCDNKAKKKKIKCLLEEQYQLVVLILWDLTKLKSKSGRLELLLVTVPGIRGAWGKGELGNMPHTRATFLHVVKQRIDSNVLRLLPLSDVPLISYNVGCRFSAF